MLARFGESNVPKQRQVKVEIYHHKRTEENVEPVKKLVFILDEVKVKEEGEKGRGKGKKGKGVPWQIHSCTHTLR